MPQLVALNCSLLSAISLRVYLQAEVSLGTMRGSSALPRLTLRRVRSVGRYNHNGDAADGGSSKGAAAAAAAGLSGEDLGPAAQMIIKAGRGSM